MPNEQKTTLYIDPINPILIPNKPLEIGSFLRTESPMADSMEQHLVRSTFTLTGEAQKLFRVDQPSSDHPFAKLTMLDVPQGSPLVTRLQITAIYTNPDGNSFVATTNVIACTSTTLKRDDQALIIYGADNRVYFVDMSVDPWNIALLGDRRDLDPGSELLVEDGTVATWLKPETTSFIWCYVLNMAALSKTHPSKR